MTLPGKGEDPLTPFHGRSTKAIPLRAVVLGSASPPIGLQGQDEWNRKDN